MIMRWWLKWFVIGALAAWIGYYRHWTSQVTRTRTTGSSRIETSLTNDTESYKFYDRLQQLNHSYFEFKEIIYAHGLCGDLKVPPMKRPCTPPLHIHLNQTEFFTLLQGQLAYQLGDKLHSCDKHTCPRPVIVPPLIPHTFWMDNNKEDLIVRVRIEPASKSSGIRQEFFENYGGVFRDQYISMWQIFVLFEKAQTYPVSLPLPLTKAVFKIGSLIGQLLGFKTEYEEYTTTTDEFN